MGLREVGRIRKRYAKELSGKPELMEENKQVEKEKGTVELVYSAKEIKVNKAVALKAALGKAIAILF